jgi:hypothetical protein
VPAAEVEHPAGEPLTRDEDLGHAADDSVPVVTATLAVLATVLLAALALFQVALAAGAPWGRFAWGGQHAVLPPAFRVGSAVAVPIYAAMAAAALSRADVVELLPDPWAGRVTWIAVGYLLLGLPMNAVSRSRAERLTMTPLVLVLAVVFGLVALE